MWWYEVLRASPRFIFSPVSLLKPLKNVTLKLFAETRLFTASYWLNVWRTILVFLCTFLRLNSYLLLPFPIFSRIHKLYSFSIFLATIVIVKINLWGLETCRGSRASQRGLPVHTEITHGWRKGRRWSDRPQWKPVLVDPKGNFRIYLWSLQ